MLQAVLKGKIPSLEKTEDILTSNVMGLLKYGRYRHILLKFLKRSRQLINPDQYFEDIIPDDTTITEIQFWPYFEKYGEPDILITTKNLSIILEIKFQSGLSGEDQLLRYHALLNNTYPDNKGNHVILIDKGAVPPDLKPSSINNNHCLWWNSWVELTETINGETEKDDILFDIIKLLEHENLFLFHGFSPIITQPISEMFWKENRLLSSYSENMKTSYFWREP